jgi:hypothetical protein
MGGIIGAIQASAVDPIQDERSLASQLANNIMVQVYGKKTVDSSKARSQQKFATANYPVTYESEAQRLKCGRIRTQNELETEQAVEQDEEPLLTKLPEFCSKYPAES